MTFLALWISFAIAAGIIGASKGIGILSFVVGMFLGPFAVIMAICAKEEH
jgi:hypothetical protein